MTPRPPAVAWFFFVAHHIWPPYKTPRGSGRPKGGSYMAREWHLPSKVQTTDHVTDCSHHPDIITLSSFSTRECFSCGQKGMGLTEPRLVFWHSVLGCSGLFTSLFAPLIIWSVVYLAPGFFCSFLHSFIYALRHSFLYTFRLVYFVD